MTWHERIGYPDEWMALKQRLVERDAYSDLVVQIADRNDGETRLFWCNSPDALATWTPERRVLLGSMTEEQSRGLVSHLAGQELVGVAAYHPEVDAFKNAWLDQAPMRRADQGMTLIHHDLPTLIEPRHCPGQARLAERSDLDVALAFQHAFREEVDLSAPPPRRAMLDIALARRELWLWQVGDEPVCYAGLRWPSANSSRIGPVYTPPEQRGKGYASALVFHLAKLGAARGRCTLFTDAANPTSNKIYRALGFTAPGVTFQEWDFAAD